MDLSREALENLLIISVGINAIIIIFAAFTWAWCRLIYDKVAELPKKVSSEVIAELDKREIPPHAESGIPLMHFPLAEQRPCGCIGDDVACDICG